MRRAMEVSTVANIYRMLILALSEQKGSGYPTIEDSRSVVYDHLQVTFLANGKWHISQNTSNLVYSDAESNIGDRMGCQLSSTRPLLK